MTEAPKEPTHDPALNPSLRRRREETHHTEHATPPPVESASVQREEGKAWPAIWLVVTVVGIVIVIYLLFL